MSDLRRAGAWPYELRVLIVALGLLNAFGITWGLPNAGGDWAIDSIAPFGPLRYAREMLYGGHWWSKYPPLHFTLLSVVYAPYAAFLALTGAPGTVADYPWSLVDPARSVGYFTLMARVVSAAMGVGVAVAAYRIGVELADRASGTLAALVFACSPLAVYYADAANLDMPYLFWSSLALLAAVRIARGAPRGEYVRLGVWTAAAVATKDQAYGLFVLLPLPLLALHPPRRGCVCDRRLVAGLAAAVATYVVAANVLVDPRGWLAHVHYITHEGSRPYQMYPATPTGVASFAVYVAGLVMQAATPPLVLFAAIGVATARRSAPWGVALLLVAGGSYCLTFLGPILYAFPRFVLPLTFVVAVFAGVGMTTTWRVSGLGGRSAVGASLAALFVYGTSMNLGLVWDSRYAAERWLAEHVPAGALVGTNGEGVYLPRVPVSLRTVRAEVTAEGLAFEGGVPDWVVLSDAYYARYLRRPATRPVLARLLADDPEWARVASFHSPHLVATNLIPSMNPRIVVLRRVGQAATTPAAACSSRNASSIATTNS